MTGKIMRLCALVAAISIWMILEPSCAATLSFDVTSSTPTRYSNLLSHLRCEVTDLQLNYGGTNLPVMARPAKLGYILIDIKVDSQTSITIALSTIDLYLQGYADKVNGKSIRGHFFSDIPKGERSKIFPGVDKDKDILVFPFKSSYSSMEGKTGANTPRSKIALGPDSLKKLINQVYGKEPNAQNEAKLMIVVVQMIAEAARFKYIEDKIVANFKGYYNPDPKAMSLQTNWQAITKGIKNSKNFVINPPLILMNADNSRWEVSQVDVIETDMALLKNEETHKYYCCILGVFNKW